MMNRGVMVAGAVLLAANGVILANVMRNRAGNPDAVVRLSERELTSVGSTSEGSEEILNLKLRWNMALGPGENGTWFDRARLEALGLTDLPSPGDTNSTANHWDHGTYSGYAVLELAGPAWEHWVVREEVRRDSTALAESREVPAVQGKLPRIQDIVGSRDSRLMAVDLGLDPQALRVQYPDRSRYLILPATYRADITWPVRDSLGTAPDPVEVVGHITELLPGTVHVPRPLRDSLLALGAGTQDSTRHFEVTLKVGKRWEAWVE